MRGLSDEQTLGIALSRGLSVETVRKISIRYRDISEVAYFGNDDISIAYDDPATVSLVLTPSAVEATDFGDSDTLGLLLTPQADEMTIFTDSGSISLGLTPSVTQEGIVHSDAATVTLALKPVIFPNLLDDFNRADQGPQPSNQWLGFNITNAAVGGEGLVVLGNAAARKATGSFRQGSYYNVLQEENVEAWIDMGALGADSALLFFRMTNPNSGTLNMYDLAINTGTSPHTWSFDKYVNGTGTFQLGGTALKNLAVGERALVRAVGSVLKAYHVTSGGVETLVLSIVDTSITGRGYMGLSMSTDQGFRVNNFGGGTPTDAASLIEAQTARVTLTPSSADVEDTVDAATASIIFTPSAVDIRVYTDAADGILLLSPAGSDVFVGIDQQTVAMGLLPSSLDVAAYVETGTANVNLLPSSTDIETAVDAGTATIISTPSSADTAQYVESATAKVTFSPSGTDTYTGAATNYVDSGTATIGLIASGTDTVQYVDSSVVRLSLGPLSTDTFVGVDSGQSQLVFTVSSVDAFAPSDTGTATFVLSPSGSDTLFGANFDVGTVYLQFRPALLFKPTGTVFGRWLIKPVSRVKQATDAKRFFAKSAKPRWGAKVWKV